MKVLLAMLAMLAAAPVWALSCETPDPVRAFEFASTDKAEWMVVYGRLSLDDSRLPAHANADVPASLKGRLLTARGFKQDFERTIILRISCSGRICGGARNGQSYMAFLRKEGRRYVAFAAPCGGLLFPRPQKADLNAVEACMRGACP